MENIDNLIDDLIEERKGDRLRGYVYRRLKEDGYAINEQQLEYLNLVIDNDRIIVIKGRQLGISTINKYLMDFYNIESNVYANIQHKHRSESELSKAKVVILDDLSANFSIYDDIINERGHRPEKVIISGIANYEGSYLHQLCKSEKYNSFKIPNTDQQIDTMKRGFLDRVSKERELLCKFI